MPNVIWGDHKAPTGSAGPTSLVRGRCRALLPFLAIGLIWSCLPAQTLGQMYPKRRDGNWTPRGPDMSWMRGEVVYRSTRDARHHWLDELDLPVFKFRSSHRGWLVRPKHFAVLSQVSNEQAIWMADQMEQFLVDVSPLLDQWTDVHRQPKFGVGMLSVWIADEVWHPYDRPSPGPRKTNFGTLIYIDLSDGPETLEQRMPQVRRECFLALLRLAQQDQIIPDWAQIGLAEYVSGRQLPDEEIHRLGPPDPPPGVDEGVWARRWVKDRMSPLGQDARAAIYWTRYVLESYDAKYAPEFFATLSAAVINHQRDPFFRADGVHGVIRYKAQVPPVPISPITGLADRPDVRAGLDDWLADRDVGQPLVEPNPSGMTLDERHREMVLILKLARRFETPATASVEPRVYEFGTERSKLIPPQAPVARPIDLAALYRRLSDPAQPRWATIDTDGSLLFSSNRGRLAEILANPRRRYRTSWREGHAVLEATFASGKVFEAWLEENPKNPRRPIARINRKLPTPTIRPSDSKESPKPPPTVF